MPGSKAFVAFAVELLSRVGPVRARAMFGGHGISCGDLMIGLVDDDEIFLKTDDGTRPRFEAEGCRQWVYTGGRKEMRTRMQETVPILCNMLFSLKMICSELRLMKLP